MIPWNIIEDAYRCNMRMLASTGRTCDAGRYEKAIRDRKVIAARWPSDQAVGDADLVTQDRIETVKGVIGKGEAASAELLAALGMSKNRGRATLQAMNAAGILTRRTTTVGRYSGFVWAVK
jgi:hypothetical protein